MDMLLFALVWLYAAYAFDFYLAKFFSFLVSLFYMLLFIRWMRLRETRKKIAFWVWRNLSGGAEPFYRNATLKKHVAPIPPDAHTWFGLKLHLWIMASSYLVKVGELTYYPTLREKF